jgi:hypothetical protein
MRVASKYLLAALLILQVNLLFSQVSGTIKDPKNQSLIGAVVFVQGADLGTSTNFSGEYKLRGLETGKHVLIFSYVGFVSDTVTVNVVNKDSTIRLNIVLKESNATIDWVEVRGALDKESEFSALKAEKNADNVINVVSARTIELSPDLTVANVAQRVSGIEQYPDKRG